jgi:thiol-disulfide isomerase/thioredoxin
VSAGAWTALGSLTAAALVGLLWRWRQGRVSGGSGRRLPEVVRSAARPDTVTLLMFCTPFCARCPQVRALLDEIADAAPGLRRADLDLSRHPELVPSLGVRSTPTTLVLSGDGDELFRVVGVPRRHDLLEKLRAHP